MSARSLLLGAAFGASFALALRTVVSAPAPPAASDVEKDVAARDDDASPSAESARARPEARPAPAAPAPARTAAAAPDLVVLARGRVTGPDGAPVDGGAPRFELEDGTALRAAAGPRGTWSVLGLRPGLVELSVEASGFLPHREAVVVPAREHWRHDVRLEAARVLPVRFETPSGEALEGRGFGDLRSYLGAFATRDKPGSPLPGVSGRVLGRYGLGTFRSRAERAAPPDLDARYQGLLELRSAPPLWVGVACRDAVLESRPLGADERELVFVLDEALVEGTRGEVRVRVVERDTGLPIEEGLRLAHSSGGIRVTPTLVEGTHVFSDVPAGAMELQLDGGEWERLQRGVHVPAGGSVDLGTIAVGRRETFEVHVADEAGAPLAVRIAAARPALAGAPSDLDVRVIVSSNAQGVAQVRHLAPGETLLRAGGRDGWARTAALVDTGRSRTVELVLARGSEVLLLRGEALPAGAELVLADVRGLVLHAGGYLPRETCLRPGDYELRVLVGGAPVERVPFHVAGERVVVRYGGA